MKYQNINKITKVAILCFAALLISSCSDFLSVNPKDSLASDEAITDMDKAYSALYGIYDLMQSRYYYGTDMITYGEVKGDDMGTTVSGDRTQSQYLFGTLQALTYQNTGRFWEYQYAGLNYANNLINAINDNQVEHLESENAELTDIKGQAIALRALFHFDLVRIHGEPYLKDKSAYGAVIAQRIISPNEKVQRSTVEETYKAIIDDLTEAIPLLSTEKSLGVINQWAAKALLAKVYLYQGNWESAYSMAKDVVDNGGYTLIPTADYEQAWSLEKNSESIFDIVSTDVDNPNRESIGYVMLPRGGDNGGYGAVSTTQAFIDLMKEDMDDIRWKVLKTNDKDFEGGYVVKYPGRGGNVYANSTRVIRLSDIYLMVAEAGVHAGKSDASSYLNAIKKRANPNVTDVTATLELVEKERRKELVGEGHRFFDIMRNLGNKEINRVGTTTYPLTKNDVLVISWNNADTYRLILPVPSYELEVNPDIYQNAGYPTTN